MKKTSIILPLFLLIVGCSKSDVEKANSLLQSYSVDFGTVTRLDSIYDYQESFEYRIKAVVLRNDADSILKDRVAALSDMKANGMVDDMNRTAKQTKNTVVEMIETAFEFDKQADFISFQKQTKNEKPLFLGYKYISKNDSCSYVVYFDKGLSKILCVGKD